MTTNPLRTYDKCDSCDEPIHTDLSPDRGWIHTVSGNYSCAFGFSGGMAAPPQRSY